MSAACGRDFKLGVVLYDAEQTVSFGERMFAVPISCLRKWHTSLETCPSEQGRTKGKGRLSFMALDFGG